MILGVHASSYWEIVGDVPSVTLKFYENVEEMTLLNFLDYYQNIIVKDKNPNGCQNALIEVLSDKNKEIIDRIIRKCISSGIYNDILEVVLFFMENAPDSLFKEVQDLYGESIGKSEIEIPVEVFDVLYKDSDDKFYSIKKIIYEVESSELQDSFCNIAVPAAYLIRSNRDINNVLKNWPSDQQVDEIIAVLAKENYFTLDKLKLTVEIIANQYNIDDETLCVMVQCLLADKVIYLKKCGFDLKSSFDKIVEKLFRCYF